MGPWRNELVKYSVHPSVTEIINDVKRKEKNESSSYEHHLQSSNDLSKIYGM